MFLNCTKTFFADDLLTLLGIPNGDEISKSLAEGIEDGILKSVKDSIRDYAKIDDNLITRISLS